MADVKPTVFRSKVAWVFGWAWIVFALLNAWDLAVRGTMPSALIAAAVLGIITVFVFLTALRPAIVAEAGGVRVRNPLRTAYIPWNALGAVTVTDAITLQSGPAKVRCWTPQASPRERARAAARAAKAAKDPNLTPAQRAVAEAAGRTHADWVAERLTALRDERRDMSTGETTVTWSWWALASVAAAVLLAGLIVVLALTG
ncbi:PH domain-containing protein [Thermobispora bispora]|uniref:PH domain-containing protein n=1 Tax=Thermobispora bispora TaxID=2006 RepID=UPI00197FF3BF|nr:PH domain-containing protein [Thermobispora bispora]MBX6167863.1 PH domain-containing protein [Thermobispora bispora]